MSAFGENLPAWKYVKPYIFPDCPEVMDELAWQRSAIEFLPQVVSRGTDPSQYASVLRSLARAAANFDVWCRGELQSGGIGQPQPPPLSAGYWRETVDAVPDSHWWWRVTPVPAYYDEGYNISDSSDDSDDA